MQMVNSYLGTCLQFLHYYLHSYKKFDQQFFLFFSLLGFSKTGELNA